MRVVFVGALLAAALVATPATEPSAGEVPGPYDQVESFVLKDLEGRTWTEKDWRGREVILRFWSVSCAACIENFPESQKLWEAHRDSKDILFLTVNLDEGPDRLRDWFKELRDEYSFPVVLAGRRFAAPARPYTWLVDREGFIRDAFVGPPGWSEDIVARARNLRNLPSVSSMPAERVEELRRTRKAEGLRIR